MTSPPTIFLAGGGTGGHLYPGIAVAEALRDILPDATCVFLCTPREIDRVILEPTGFEFVAQPIVPPVRTIGGLLNFWRSWRETKDLVRRMLKERAPAAVLGLGGYAAGVAVKLSALHRVPTAILNPDVIPGKANQYLMRYAQAVCCQFEQTARHVSQPRREKLRVTGCPIRADLLDLPSREQAAGRLELDPLLHTLVITGASQGARTVNEAALEAFKSIRLQGWQILHLAGADHAAGVRAEYRELGLPARVIDFTAAMADVWAVADLAVSRAGASTCAELTACGVPGLLLPYPYHRDMHQRANAEVLAEGGAAIVIEDTKDRRATAAQLRPALESLLHDAPRRQQLADNARSLAHPDAARNVAQHLQSLISPAPNPT